MPIGSLAQEIIEATHSLATTDSIYRAILASARFHRDKRMWFSNRTFNFPLVAGKAAYSLGDGPPKNLVEIVGTYLWVLIGGSNDNRMRCRRTPTAELEASKLYGTSTSQPQVWDFFNNQLRFYPTPSSSTDVVEGRYVIDLGVPIARYNTATTTWDYYAPDGIQKLTTATLLAYDNDWFNPQSAGHLVLARANYLLYNDYLHDADMATTWLNRWLELSAQLTDETEAKDTGATPVVGCILDGVGWMEGAWS